MTSVVAEDGCTYTFENGVLTISGTGTANSMRSGAITGLDASTMTSLIVEPGITSLGQELMFRQCNGLTYVQLPEGLTNIGSYDFMECANLTSIILPSTLTYLAGYAFYGCTKLEEVIFKGNQPTLRSLCLSTNNTSGTTIYSNGWANSTTVTSDEVGSTSITFVGYVPVTYSKIIVNGQKVQVDSAIRDGNGKKIDTNYQPILVSGTNIKTINNTSLLGSGDITVGGSQSIGSILAGIRGRIYGYGTGGISIYYRNDDGTSTDLIGAISSNPATLSIDGTSFTFYRANVGNIISAGSMRMYIQKFTVTLNSTTYSWYDPTFYED